MNNKNRRQNINLARKRHRDLLTALAAEQDNIKELKLTCPHDWTYLGHGHNEEYWECWICNKTETR